MTDIKNISDLISDLSVAYGMLRNKELPLSEAHEIANIAGKMINGASVQLNYNQYMKISDPIPFLEKSKV
jgi:hypothetical protein